MTRPPMVEYLFMIQRQENSITSMPIRVAYLCKGSTGNYFSNCEISSCRSVFLAALAFGFDFLGISGDLLILSTKFTVLVS